MKMEIMMRNIHTGEVYYGDGFGVVEKLDLRRRQHRDGWVAEPSVSSGIATGRRWLKYHGYTVDEFTVQARLVRNGEAGVLLDEDSERRGAK